MKIKMEEDFIYLCSGVHAKLILHNCPDHCKFCPASKLKCFYNYPELNSVFDYTCEDLTIYGNVNISYIETFLQKLKSLNPKVKIHVEGCDCVLSQKIDLEYRHIIYPNLVTYFKLMPKEFILPATGDNLIMGTFARTQRRRYPEIPIKVKVTEAADQNVEFWTDNQIDDFVKQLDTEDHRI